jgi:phenol hydroxylase P0 protein
MDKSFDLQRRYVQITDTLPNGLIEFLFSIGEPDVAVELVMPKVAFDEFCRNNAVEFLQADSPSADPQAAVADFQWSLHQATHQRFR